MREEGTTSFKDFMGEKNTYGLPILWDRVNLFLCIAQQGAAPGVLDFDFHIVYEAFPLDRHMCNTQAHITYLFISSSEDLVPDCSQRRNFVRRCLS